jgi:hypothetical protein
MPSRAAKKSKRDALKRHGTLNPHPDAVTDPLFEAGDFFDRDDLLQLKYEMLRRVTVDKQSVTQSATAFGFSRPTYYQAEADFQRDGLFGLLPEKRGPRQAHKLTPEVLDFAVQLRVSDPSLRPLDLAAAIQERFAINAHPRSIERALRRQERNVAESNRSRTQDSGAGSTHFRLRRSTAASRPVFDCQWLRYGHFSWPGNGGVDAGVPLAHLHES